MMDTQVDRELLEKIADLIGKPVGAFNIRKDCGCDGRVSTEHIKIDDRTDGHAGIDIRILDGTKGETCHIPVIITKSGVEETVYNDFYIGEDCDVEIVAGCGIHNCGDQESRHDGIHTFHVGKNSHVHYSEKHYAEGDGRGEKIMNPRPSCIWRRAPPSRWTRCRSGAWTPPSGTPRSSAARGPRPSSQSGC